MAETKVVHTADDRVLSYCLWGPDGGRPVFFLHGTPGSRYLRHLGGEYERQGVRAITYDRPGCGRSTRLPGRTVAQAASDIRAVADDLGLASFAVAGVSGGGPPALAAAALLPDRVTRCATIVGVVPYDAEGLDWYDGMDAEAVAEWQAMRSGESHIRGTYYAETRAWVESLADDESLPPHVRTMVIEAFREGLVTADGAVDDFFALEQPWGFDPREIRCPTTVMVAEEDTAVPVAHGRWLAARVPGSSLQVVPGGHMGPREEAEEDLLGWLAGSRD